VARKPARRADLVAAALQADRPTRWIAFHPGFDPATPYELVKDVVAIANSGGGVVVVGSAEPLAVADWVSESVGERWDDLEIVDAVKDGRQLAIAVVGARALYPLVFTKQTAAFAKGTVYFRHGARSEPAVPRDLERFATAEAAKHRKHLMQNFRKLSAAPEESEVIVVTPNASPAGTVDRFRVVDDPDAPAVARTDFDITHPYRQKELINTLNDRLGAHIVGPFEILSVRRVHAVDDVPEFFHRPKFGSPQYSNAFVAWITNEYQRDPDFFTKAKDAYKASRA
jgi:hypothetical protein